MSKIKKFNTLVTVNIILSVLLYTLATSVFALTQNEKLWIGAGTVRDLSSDGKWRYLLMTQARFIDESHPVQSILAEGGIGNVISKHSTLWAGYRYTGRNPYNGYTPEDRLFQQIVSKLLSSDSNEITYRARLEELIIRDTAGISLRLRHRLAFTHKKAVIYNLEPYLFDEIYTQLNRTEFTPNYFIFENRAFLGFKIRVNKKKSIELGYMNQYQMRQRNQSQNVMSHVLVIMYDL